MRDQCARASFVRERETRSSWGRNPEGPESGRRDPGSRRSLPSLLPAAAAYLCPRSTSARVVAPGAPVGVAGKKDRRRSSCLERGGFAASSLAVDLPAAWGARTSGKKKMRDSFRTRTRTLSGWGWAFCWHTTVLYGAPRCFFTRQFVSAGQPSSDSELPDKKVPMRGFGVSAGISVTTKIYLTVVSAAADWKTRVFSVGEKNEAARSGNGSFLIFA